jgi:hypothetical protein
VVDEARLFAPAMGGDVSDEARRTSLAAMTDLMCRGRKRGHFVALGPATSRRPLPVRIGAASTCCWHARRWRGRGK